MAGELGAYAEHSFQRIIPGDAETVRQRLSAALEDFNYIVLSDNPIQAKRPRQKSIWVSMVLDYDVKLVIAFRSISPASTLVTFDYSIEQLFTKGEMLALEREAEAIIAMARATSVEIFCPSCGAESSAAVRFCRSCGMPLAKTQLPSELEVMRLTASASGSQIEIALGLLLCLITLLIALPMIFFVSSVKGIAFGWIVFALGEGLGLFYLLLGLRRLRSALSPPEAQPDSLRARSVEPKAALPAEPVSITEGTTELIRPAREIHAAAKSKDTGSME